MKVRKNVKIVRKQSETNIFISLWEPCLSYPFHRNHVITIVTLSVKSGVLLFFNMLLSVYYVVSNIPYYYYYYVFIIQ